MESMLEVDFNQMKKQKVNAVNKAPPLSFDINRYVSVYNLHGTWNTHFYYITDYRHTYLLAYYVLYNIFNL